MMAAHISEKRVTIFPGMNILWEWQCFPGCAPKIRIHRWGRVLSVRIIRFCPWGTMDFRIGCSDDEFPWAREGDPLDTKYLYVTHSELNAILNYSGRKPGGSEAYMFHCFPCNECAKAIIQSGIKTVDL